MLKSQKAEVIEELEERDPRGPALIVTDYRGLSVRAISGVRTGLRPLDATFRVSKNTLARIAAERAGNDGLADMLTGPTAIAFCKGDPAASRRSCPTSPARRASCGSRAPSSKARPSTRPASSGSPPCRRARC